jgi:glycine cleavage system H lipoate-binding protein
VVAAVRRTKAVDSTEVVTEKRSAHVALLFFARAPRFDHRALKNDGFFTVNFVKTVNRIPNPISGLTAIRERNGQKNPFDRRLGAEVSCVGS